MRIRIGGVDYPVVSHRGANLLHLIELREHTRRLFEQPLGMARLDELERVSSGIRRQLAAVKLEREAAVEAGDELEVERLDGRRRELEAEQADDGLLGMAIIIFLSRRKAGDRVTFAQSIDLDLAEDVEWIPDPDDALPVAPNPDDGVPLDGAATAAPDPHGPAPASLGTPGDDPAVVEPAPAAPTVKRKRKPGRSTTSGSR